MNYLTLNCFPLNLLLIIPLQLLVVVYNAAIKLLNGPEVTAHTAVSESVRRLQVLKILKLKKNESIIRCSGQVALLQDKTLISFYRVCVIAIGCK